MADLPHLTANDVSRLATQRSFDRGEDYYHSGAVFDPQRRGSLLSALVEGSQYEPYRVTVTLDAAGVLDADCSCPYDWGGVCKHIVAVLLTYIHKPEAFVVRLEPAELLHGLDAETLRHVLDGLLTQHPYLQDEVEAVLEARSAQAAPSTAKESHRRRTPVDPAPFRRQVIGILHSLDSMRHSEAYWAVGGMVDQLRQILQTAQDFLDADDAENALTILRVLSEEVIETYPEFEYADTDMADFILTLGEPLAEALLSRELTPSERQEWQDRLHGWTAHLDDYGLDEALDQAIAALAQGWQEPPPETLEVEDEYTFLVDLTDVKLNILERRGQTEAFLELAQEGYRHLRYASKLVELDRASEAMQYALAHFSQAGDALTLAQQLREVGRFEKAVAVAERGLSLSGSRHRLGTWLSDLAVSLGQAELALSARLAAFESLPSLEDYQTVRELAGSQWDSLQPRLMTLLREQGSDSTLVDVLLHEGQIAEAIAVADENVWNYRLLEQVAEAAVATHPEWVVRVGQREAEALINKVQRKYYTPAVRWLQKVRTAYQAQGQDSAWESYLTALRQRHGRKRTLMGMLDEMERKIS
jgi:uncharacterized Zn finger protein